MNYTIENEELILVISSHGAEVRSLKDKKTGREYMWCGDAAYWGRVSPVLFPIVGAVKDNTYRFKDKTYHMSQHGFARDMDFCLTEESEREIWFCLTEQEATLEKYPFPFVLEIGYKLEGRKVKVMWRVTNPSEEPLYFSIGGHPAFCCEKREAERITCYLKFEGVKELVNRKLEGGLASDTVEKITLKDGGYLPVTEELFAEDALIIENRQTQEVSLCDSEKVPYLTVKFDAPLFGVWSPVGKNAPFICIEPWYGRCDSVRFDGSLEEREWGSELLPNTSFQTAYTVSV